MAEVQQQQELRDVLQAAQTALEEGRSQEAVAACRHVLRHYPDAITALRLLGEAYLEAGRTDEAGRAFDKALSIDPQNVLARVGLGVIAEDRGEDERAIAQFRLAWEAEPTLPQLRGELVRLYRKRYGAGGRLRLTRVALANLHKRNDDLLRAIAQLRQLHQEDPSRPEVALSLAEALWRHEEDGDAALLCHHLLAERPNTARALLLLASIRGDNGVAAGQGVDELLAQARGLDPDLTLTGELIAQRPSETLITFADDVPTVPAFDPATATDDGTDEFVSQGGPATPMTRWEDIASGLSGETTSIRSATSMGVIDNATAPTPAAPATDEVDQLFAAIDRELAMANEHGAGELPDVLPFDLPEDGAADEPAAEWETPEEDTMMPSPDEPTAVERLTANWDNIDNELAAARPSDDAPVGMTGMLSSLGDLEGDLVPFDVDKASEEQEEVISFDPSKFSLPPLDGEEDDDFDPEDAALEDEIAPFSLESAGVRPKTAGLTFTDLVGKESRPLPVTSDFSGGEDAESSAVADSASIFATRELSSLPESELQDMQVAVPETDPLADTRVLVPGTSPIAAEASADTGDDAAPLPTATEEGDDTLVAPAWPAADDLAAEATAPHVSTSELDKLLSTGTPRLATPESAEHYPVDATRPLLADEAMLLGLAAATPVEEEDRLVSKAPAQPAADDEVGMGQLFNRLRNRKQERIHTGELLVNRRLQSDAVPGPDTGEIAGPLRSPRRPEASLPTAADAAPADDATMPGLDDDWMTASIDADAPAQGDTADFLAAIAGDEAAGGEDALLPTTGAHEDEGAVDDSWLTSLVGDAPVATNGWGVAESSPGAARRGRPAEGADRVVDPAESAGDGPAGGWASLLDRPAPAEIPEQPEPPAWLAASATSDAPNWGDEALDEFTPVPARPEPVAAGRAAADSVVMRVRTTPEPVAEPRGAAHPAASSGRPAVAHVAPRQTEQLAKLATMVETDPENHFARLTLAVAYGSGGQPEQALNEYRRLIKDADELVPEVAERLKEMIADGAAPPRAHRVLGDAYMKLGQFDLAMAEFQRALTARPRAAK